MGLCKKHGKERDTLCVTKPGRNGSGISFVGCVDCKAGLPATIPAGNPPKAPAPKKPSPAVKRSGRPKLDELPPEPTPNTKDTPPPAKKGLSERFGFRFR